MRLSELLGSTVVTADGRKLGTVRDVRLVQDGPVISGTQAALRVDALVVSTTWRGVRLGYLRGEVRGPWLLRSLFGRLERTAHHVAVADVDWDETSGLVRIRAGVRV